MHTLPESFKEWPARWKARMRELVLAEVARGSVREAALETAEAQCRKELLIESMTRGDQATFGAARTRTRIPFPHGAVGLLRN